MASGGCSHLVIQEHIAADRYEATSDCYVATQFVSGLRPVMLTRMVPKADFKILLSAYEQQADSTQCAVLDLIHGRICFLEDLIGVHVTSEKQFDSNAGRTLVMNIAEHKFHT